VKNLVIAVAVLAAIACSRDRAKQPPASEPTAPSLAFRFANEIRARAPELRVEIVGDLEVRIFADADDEGGSSSSCARRAPAMPGHRAR